MIAQLLGPDHGIQTGIPGDLAQRIIAGCEQHPQATLIEYGFDGEPWHMTSRELHARAWRICSELSTVDASLPLILCFERAIDYVPAAWAAVFGGRWSVPWQLTATMSAAPRAQSRLRAIRQCFPKACLLFSKGNERFAREVLAGSPGWISCALDSGVSPEQSASPMAPVSGGGCYLPTAGSSGGAKFAGIGNRALYARNEAAPAALSDRISLVAFPFDGVTGSVVMFPWSGTRVLLPAGRLLSRPHELPALVGHHRINTLVLSTTLLAKFVDVLETGSDIGDLSSIDQIALGAEPLSAALIRRLIAQCRRLGITGPKFSLGYGMTETGALSRVSFESPAAVLAHFEQGADPIRLGGATRYTAIRIADGEDRVVDEGSAGEIHVHAPLRMFDGYRTVNGLDRSCFTQDGWFRTGDRGWIDAGQLTVLGRSSGSMRLAGRTVSLEPIETALYGAEGLLPGAMVAIPVRSHSAALDELALFFSVRPDHPGGAVAVAKRLRHGVLELVGSAPRHLVCVPESEFPLTPAGKPGRAELARGYLEGRWKPIELGASVPDTPASTDLHSRLRRIWSTSLHIDPAFPDSATFFELGADSLQVATMVLEVERSFSVRIPLQAFFESPTLATLARLLSASGQARPVTQDGADARLRPIVRQLETALRGWPGWRASPRHLIAGQHPDGSAAPLFWVFQGEREFVQLGKALGPDQPLFGLRSLVGLLPVRNYDRETLEAVCDLYAPCIEAQRPTGRLVLGGNCQGGIVALALARRLRRRKRQVEPLVLMEWSFSYGPYDGPVELLYGCRSYTAPWYTGASTEGPDWRGDFPHRKVQAIAGRHGAYFTQENIASLAGEIRRITG